MSERVAITGLGAVTSLGLGCEALISGWLERRSGITDGVAPCSEFSAANGLTKKQRRRADRFTQFALVAAAEAVSQARWADRPPAPSERIACIIGTGVGGIGTIESQHDCLRDRGAQALSPLAVPLMMANAASGTVAMEHCLKGECYGTVSACAAGAHAIGAGMRLIRHGIADACLVGGAEAAMTPLASNCFIGMGATSSAGISRPFDRRRDGFVMGEGAGVLALESASSARTRSATILGWVDGYGASADAHHLTAPEPNGEGAARAIALALADAGWEPEDLDYVNAHGTSTQLNDKAETQALKRALGGAAASIPVSSTKSAIGHLLGAAGAVEAVATVSALRRGALPPTLNLEEPDPELDLDYVADGPRMLPVGAEHRAISNSFGFGGHNAVVCVSVERA